MGAGVFFENLRVVLDGMYAQKEAELDLLKASVLDRIKEEKGKQNIRIAGIEVPGIGCFKHEGQQRDFEWKLNGIYREESKNKNLLGEANKFEFDLSNLGIEPMAVLPIEMWLKLCKSLELYTFFYITEFGHVPIDWGVERSRRWYETGKDFFSGYTQDQIKKTLWPECTNFIEGQTEPDGRIKEPARTSFRINLPLPPDNVVDILKKIHGYAERGILKSQKILPAVTLDKDSFQVEANSMQIGPILGEDPIILLVSGSAVAIVAQYGDFRREKEALEIARVVFAF